METRRLILVLSGFLFCSSGTPARATGTTFYVAKHFEVRDHDQPTKYVFNGSTRVARITGSLSSNDRIQRFRLRTGWNLLSLAITAANALQQLNNSPFPILNASSVVRWNQTAQNWLPISANQTLPAGTVLWVNATTNASLSVRGTYSEPVNRTVNAGATYLATPGLEAWTPDFPLTLTAWHFNPPPETLSSSSLWLARLGGELSSVNDLPHTFAPGQALYVTNGAPFELTSPEPALRIRYYHQDHINSSSVMTDASGTLIQEAAFYPFGIPRHEHRLRQTEEPYQFTQKERDQESGLHYFEARFLASQFGRFLSADPKYANLEAATPDPQQLNVYAYARNNPVLYVDPNGLDFGVPEPAESLDEVDVDTTVEALGGLLDNTAIGNFLKGPPRVKDAASFSAGIGDSIIDPIADFAGCKSFGLGFGRFTRLAFGINNVDESSSDYGGGHVLGTMVQFAIGAGEVKAAVSSIRAGGSLRSARSAIDPLADTAPAGGNPTIGSRGSGVGEIRSAPIGGSGGGGLGATPLVGGGGGLDAAGSTYMKIFQQQNQSLQAMRTIALGGEVQIDSAITKMAFDQADAIWRATYGTRPPIMIPRR